MIHSTPREIRRRDDLKLPVNGDCVYFVVHHLDMSDVKSYHDLLKILTEFNKPSNGELAVVVYEEFHGFARHLGFFKNGRVISKWCDDPVYEHFEDGVENEWKKGIKYYTIPPEKINHIDDLFD